MAAVPDPQVPSLLELWQVNTREIEPMLAEEVRCWRQSLEWDFQPSADLVRRFVDVHALNGYALMEDGRVAGYAYYVCEERKGLIGDLFVSDRFRTAENEHRLLAATVEHLMRVRRVRRIESQLMMSRSFHHGPLPSGQFARLHPRYFMLLDLAHASEFVPKTFPDLLFDKWTEKRQDEAAHVIANAYRSHIDSEINDQYRSVSGARRFLFNIVQYPGCGTFYQPASWVVMSRDTGRLCGVSLTSIVAPGVGHVTQICVLPSLKHRGAGYELLRRSITSLAAGGASQVSLTVTAANRNAVTLYERVGFRVLREFPALVWDNFQS